MPTYIYLCNYTQQGIADIKNSPQRADKARQLAKASGGSLDQIYLTMGRYDMVVIGQAPDDTTVASNMLTIGSAGAIRSETLRAFTEEEYRSIIANLP